MSTTPIGSPVPDTRPKGVAWTALILAVVGIVLSLVGFVPIAWVGVISAVVGGVVLFAALIVAIVGLVAKRNGGTAISITALVLSVLGGLVGSVAIVVALVFTGLYVQAGAGSGSSTGAGATPQASASPSDEATETPSAAASEAATDAEIAAGQAAFLAEVRPQVNDLMREIDPSITPDVVSSAFPDEALLTMGQALLVTGEAGIDPLVSQAQASLGDTVTADQLRSIFETVYQAAKANLK